MTTLITLLQTVFVALLLSALFMLPMIVVAVRLYRQKKAYKAEADEPFTTLPLRPPGESLRLRIEELGEKFDEELMIIWLAGLAAAMITVAARSDQRLIVAVVAGIIALGVSIRHGRKLFALARLLWDYRLGFAGERVVGEELNQLLESGFRVFHDVPFDTFNVDHVIVGPPGVYVVETKARRKPAHVVGEDRARIIFDGQTLHFANSTETKAVDQVLRNAKTVSDWLTSATGEPVTAKGILTFPGWFIEKNDFAHVRVMNPEMIKFHFLNHPRRSLDAPQIQRIAHQLTERCRIPKESK